MLFRNGATLVFLLWFCIDPGFSRVRAEGSMFLRLALDAGEVRLLEVRESEISAKQPRVGHPTGFWYEVASETGVALFQANFDNPFRDVEAASPDGVLTRVGTSSDSVEFTLRVPRVRNAARLRLYQGSRDQEPPSAERSQAFAFTLMGEVSLSPASGGGLTAMATTGTLYTLFENGPRSNRLNLVVFGDGFRAAELASFTNRAKSTVDKFLGALPMSEYRTFFNAYAIFTASVESGSDHPSRNSYKNTYFNSTYDSHGISYLVTIPPNDRDGVYSNGKGKVDALLQRHLPDYDISMLIVNDSDYGGSGGSPAIASVNGSSGEIMVHELGHSFAKLGDEYGTPYPGYPEVEEPNTTRETRRDFIKWNAWILAATPIPTPETSTYATRVGLFEGAHYHETGWYRPKLDCKMQTLGVEFCEVCRQALILSTYNLVSPFDDISPAGDVILTSATPAEFRVDLLKPAGQPTRVEWRFNGDLLAGEDGPAFILNPVTAGPGAHELSVTVADETTRVRTDPAKLLEATHSWRVQISLPVPLQILQARFEGNTFTFQLSRDVPAGVVEISEDLSNWTGVLTNSFSAHTPINIAVDNLTGNGVVFIRMSE